MTAAGDLEGRPEDLGGAPGPDFDVVHRHRPLLRLDANEPYRPSALGYTVFREPAPSPSSKFEIVPRGAVTVEYAVWYDWDIQHLYDLEHVWVHLDAAGTVLAVEASFHGKRLDMVHADGLPEMRDGRPILYCEPGKHAHWADGALMRDRAGSEIWAMCSLLAGRYRVHTGNRFAQAGAFAPTPLDDRLAELKLARDGFTPSFAFTRDGDEQGGPALVPWPLLEAWIPARVRRLMAGLPESVPHLRAVFLDSGDTLVDEGTENKRPGTDVVLEAELIAGAREAVQALKDRGYPLALVADGPRETFENVLKPHGLWDLFDAHVISGDIGETKPSPKMFAAAMAGLGIGAGQACDVVMVGNNLSRDIKGANAAGIRSVFFAWSDRRSHIPADASEKPDFTITNLADLAPLLDLIERHRLGRTPRREAGEAI
ncbi:HAD family hydrolase [Consotaella aegiceratis]|uniref:HAD family hydrolase n=1 Tax=Consotaella aegiceratis TaxID=3097961 RepID=UPI002F4194B2